MADTKTAKSEEVEEKANAVESEAQVDTSKIDAEVLQNIPVTVSVEVGRTSLKIRDLMRLAQGSVVELDRLAGESLDLMVNNTPVAQGEIVLVNERYGIKLTSVVPTDERVKNLLVIILHERYRFFRLVIDDGHFCHRPYPAYFYIIGLKKNGPKTWKCVWKAH